MFTSKALHLQQTHTLTVCLVFLIVRVPNRMGELQQALLKPYSNISYLLSIICAILLQRRKRERTNKVILSYFLKNVNRRVAPTRRSRVPFLYLKISMFCMYKQYLISTTYCFNVNTESTVPTDQLISIVR